MSIPDSLILNYLELAARVSLDELKAFAVVLKLKILIDLKWNWSCVWWPCTIWRGEAAVRAGTL